MSKCGSLCAGCDSLCDFAARRLVNNTFLFFFLSLGLRCVGLPSAFLHLSLLLLLNHLEVLWSQHEVASEVFLLHDAVFRKLLWGAFEEDASLEEEICPIGDAKCLLHVVVGDEDADVAVFQFPHHILYVFHGDRVHACKRLIEHDELWVDGKASGYLASSSLAS